VIKTFTSPRGEEKLIVTHCKICGSKRFREVYGVQSSIFVRCLSCGVVYQNPVPGSEDLANRYTSDYFEYEFNNESNFFGLMKLGLADIGFDKMEKAGFENTNFLDIGCATGMLLEHMKNAGWRVSGVDICPQSARYGTEKRNVPIFAGTLEDARFPDKHFSIIHFSHLIEHVTDPKTFMSEVRRILSDSGMAIITTPNIEGFQARLFGKSWRSAIPDHIHLFSKRTLSRLIVDSGFKVMKTVTWGGIAKGAAPQFIKAPLDKLAKKWGFGDVMLILVRKQQDNSK
jgi:2-polyprenyl-3-methyl-5-hydroxy-6-metoxy-1,4-benzoquinol methylase